MPEIEMVNDQPAPAKSAGEDDFQFDVIVSLPMSMDKAVLTQRAIDGLGVPPEAVERLMTSLTQHRILKVKSGVDRKLADETAEKFEKVGFRVEIAHCLGLRKAAPVQTDGKVECPACDTKVIPSPETQCPSCGVFINKLSEDFLERKRIMKKERARLEAMYGAEKAEAEKLRKAEAERLMREEILAELEKEFGISTKKKGLMDKVPRWAMPALTAVAIVGAFFGGRSTGYEAGGSAATSSMNASAAAKEAAEAAGDDVAKLEAATKKMKADMAAAAGAIQRPFGGGAASGSASGSAVDPKDSLGTPAAGEAAAADTPANPITNDAVKREVAYELVMLLAEIGQLDRARELVGRAVAGGAASNDVKLTLQLRIVQLEVEAWAIVHGQAEKPQEQADGLLKSVGEIPDAGERSIAGASIGAILLRRPDVNPQTVDAFFKLANDSYKATKGKASNSRVGQEVVAARGRGILNAVRARAERGMMQQAAGLAQELSAMAQSVSGPAAAVLYGYEHEANRMLGNAGGAQKSLELGLTKARKSGSLQQEGASLRSIIDGGNVYQNPNVQTAISTLMTAAQKWGGADYAATLVELGLIHARNGNDTAYREVQTKLAELIKTKPDYAFEDERLRGMTEVTLAWKAKRANDLGAAEGALRRAAGMVL
ncbi:MAG: hypothetical protein KBA96_12210 [Rhodocyclaceae bacterium]|nr:hypothetical protein [Rhodocyclaceae bacterium]